MTAYPQKQVKRLEYTLYGIMLGALFLIYFGNRLVLSLVGRFTRQTKNTKIITNSRRYDSRIYGVDNLRFEDLPEGNVWRQMAAAVPENAVVLDVGCSTGHLGRMLVDSRHCTVDGIEIDPDAAAIAAQSYRQVFAGDLSDGDFHNHIPLGAYDVALYMDVLEHLAEPGSLINQLERNLKGSGFALASIPNVANWQVRFELMRGRFEYTDLGTGIMDQSHLRFFTLSTLKGLFEQSGYQVDWIAASFPNWHPLFEPLRFLPRSEDMRLRLLELFPELLSRQFLIRACPVWKA
ncbi:MAG: class I SAM-dependent methyltransferase [Chloroflexota bacterium]|nr:MAG: class I SAM-dependent methyltransferase [Chloroflexota bacterium]